MSGLSIDAIDANKRKKLYEDYSMAAQQAQAFVKNAMNFNSAVSIGQLLGGSRVRETSSSAASSL